MTRTPHFFIVASRGLTATTWLARALNRHPSVFCSHGRDRPERGPETDELLLQEKYRKDRLRCEQRQRGMPLAEYLETLRQAADGQAVVGNVHGFVLSELLDKLSSAGLGGTIPIATMFRNPFTFLASYTALVCHRKLDYPEKFAAEHLPRARANRQRLLEFGCDDIERHLDVYGFTEACHMLVKMVEELAFADVPLILMERIVTDRAYFREVALHLTGGKCEFDNGLVESIFRQTRLNSHRAKLKAKPAPPGAEDEYRRLWKSWPPVKKRIFRRLVTDAHLCELTRIGYDVSFV